MWEKLRTAVTDVNRVRRSDPGDPEICNIFTMHRAFSPEEALPELDKGCRAASIGCIECKRALFKQMTAELGPIREKALDLKNNRAYVEDALKQGAKACRALAVETMEEVRGALGLLRA